MIRLMVADDHGPTREQAVTELASGDMIQIVAQAETTDEVYKTAQKLLPDIVLLDLHMPGLITTADLIKRLTQLRNVKVVMYASQGKASEVQDLLDCGAAAYILKTDPSALIRMTLLMVFKGSRGVISPSLPRHLTRLTSQERTILRQLTMRGKLPKAAERMGITESELEEAANQLAQKLELDETEALIKWAKKHGF